MSIIDRIKRLAQANIHGLLDKVEAPELVLQGKIDELEQAIGEAREALADFAISRKRLEMERAKSERSATDWMERAELDLKESRESSARNSLMHRIRSLERADRLSGMLEQSRKVYEELKESVVVLSNQLRTAKLNLSELQSRKRAAEAQRMFGGKLDKAMSVSSHELDFSPLEEDVLRTETELEIDHRIRTDMAAIDKEIEQQKFDSRVDLELENLKRKLGRKG